MKRLGTLLFLALFVAPAFSQESPLKSGAWALMFGVGPDLTVTEFAGADLSGKYHLTSNSAVRTGLSLRFDGADRTTSSEADAVSDQSTGASMLGIRVDYLRYPMSTSAPVQFMFGGGLLASTAGNSNLTETGQTETEHSSRQNLVGLSGVIGAEWFLNGLISLTAEYRPILALESETKSSEIRNPSSGTNAVEETSDRLFLDLGGAYFGLSIYF